MFVIEYAYLKLKICTLFVKLFRLIHNGEKLAAALCALSIIEKTHHQFCDTPLPVYLNRFFGICYRAL